MDLLSELYTYFNVQSLRRFSAALLLYALSTTPVTALDVESYYGTYNTLEKEPGFVANSLEKPTIEAWEPIEALSQTYKIGVLVPHLTDHYWLSINYGIIEQAKKHKVSVKLLSAGGYGKGGIQKQQLTDDLLKHNVSGIILGSIFYDKLDKFIEQVIQDGIPIVSMVNDVHAQAIQGKVQAFPYQVGEALGNFMIEDAKGKDLKVAFFPGPKGSLWAPLMFNGFMKSLRENVDKKPIGKITIVAEQYGPISRKYQRKLLEHVLSAKDEIDYIFGNAVLALEAPVVLEKFKKKNPNVKIISTYLLPDVYKGIKAGKIYASMSESPVQQGQLALDMILKILEGKRPGSREDKLPFVVTPISNILTKSNLEKHSITTMFAPDDFKETLEYDYQDFDSL